MYVYCKYYFNLTTTLPSLISVAVVGLISDYFLFLFLNVRRNIIYILTKKKGKI